MGARRGGSAQETGGEVLLGALNLEAIDGVFPANQARSRDAQQRLMRAGETVFAQLGYDAVHVSHIAAAAQCSIGSFYRRFRDKEALFRALHTQFVLQGRENVDRFFAMPRWRDAPTSELIRTLVTNTAKAIARHPGFFRALFQRSLAGGGDAYFASLRDADVNAGRRLAEFLRTRGKTGADLEAACIFALQSVEAMLLQRLLHGARGNSITDPQLIERLYRQVMTYLELSPD